MSRALLKWMAQKKAQTRSNGMLDCVDPSQKLHANQSNHSCTAKAAAVAANVIKALQQKAAQLNIV